MLSDLEANDLRNRQTPDFLSRGYCKLGYMDLSQKRSYGNEHRFQDWLRKESRNGLATH